MYPLSKRPLMLIPRQSPGCERSASRAFIISSTPYNGPLPHCSLWSSSYVYINLRHINRVTPASHQLLSLLPWKRKGQRLRGGRDVGKKGLGLVAQSKRGRTAEALTPGGASSGEASALALRARQVRHHPHPHSAVRERATREPSSGWPMSHHTPWRTSPLLCAPSLPERLTSHLSSRICRVDKAPTEVSTWSRGWGAGRDSNLKELDGKDGVSFQGCYI